MSLQHLDQHRWPDYTYLVATRWKERQNAERDLAREQTRTIELERRRGLEGWSGHGVETYGVTLVTDDVELEQAASELAGGKPTDYVICRVSESGFGNENRAHSLRQLIQHGGLISRPPTTGEREALERGLDELGIPRASFGQVKPDAAGNEIQG